MPSDKSEPSFKGLAEAIIEGRNQAVMAERARWQAAVEWLYHQQVCLICGECIETNRGCQDSSSHTWVVKIYDVEEAFKGLLTSHDAMKDPMCGHSSGHRPGGRDDATEPPGHYNHGGKRE